MNRRFQRRHLALLIAALFMVSTSGTAGSNRSCPTHVRFANPTGFAATYSTVGKIDLTGPFFQSLGTNGRACVSCHQPSVGWTVTPPDIQARFEASAGTDPIFRTVRRLEFPQRRRFHARGSARRLQHAAQQGPDPHRHRHPVRMPSSNWSRWTTPTAMPVPASCRCSGARCRRPTSNS